MALEHDDAPRFTLDQRDAILNLAARLQVQHEATVGADELVREAQAAGIDARFVYEATVRPGRKSRPASSLRGAIFAFVLLVIQAIAIMLLGHALVRQGGDFGDVNLIAGVGIAFLLSLWAAQNRAIRRYVPLVAFATWVTVGFATFIVENESLGLGSWFVIHLAVPFGLAETLAAFVAVLARKAAEWRPEDGRSFRLPRRS